ncbi:transcription factor Tfb4 [Coccomyxa subellipsoidea C-169]|uniref:General transcription and DNA repair factor IIH subunit TFB4 n=1 Tax=Coccomyxa subellipsoidea (strain C-169) TaxID=574566 RepID=I0Z6M2_COCSC|nr:transcription factor Tfb4 [Coccomyxa subellipsoidea C-169]EIE26291.1 transcription factor Tfb4 [Coccomyxa subellipsoidea C-169]|eukprot:XP_005650835.1 transcription factor Tfb4 [Coccomyxa subellipsoidea C-169]
MAPSDEDDDSCLLVVVLETHEDLWSALADESESPVIGNLSLTTLLQQVLVFLNTFLALNEANELVVIAACGDQSEVLYTSPSVHRERQGPKHGAVTGNASEEVLKKLHALLQEQAALPVGDHARPAVLAGALSRALCLINKAQLASAGGSRTRKQPRLLCLKGSPDATEQYISVMNAIFAAQRCEVVIDACMLGASDSAFLQQAAHLTNGIYLRPKHKDALLQYLLTIFCGDAFSRSFLQLPRPIGVDFRAACFCHRRAIDLGYVCSVCLSIFCESITECSTCGTTFKVVARTPATKRKASAAAV